jgi:hypothetical protein
MTRDANRRPVRKESPMTTYGIRLHFAFSVRTVCDWWTCPPNGTR